MMRGRRSPRPDTRDVRLDAYIAWVAAGLILVIAELLTSTFYLLVLGLAALVAGGVAWAGGAFWLQAVVGAGVAVAGVLWVNRVRRARQGDQMPSLDLGQPVTLDEWVNRADRLARVKYRDALWDARIEGEHRGDAGEVFYIRAVQGSVLVVAKGAP
jgi:membrane protein implicated in regulation of membrane protease activity